MRDHELPDFSRHFAHVFDPAKSGAFELILASFKMDGYKETGKYCSLDRELSCLDYFVSPDVLASHLPSRGSDTLSRGPFELQMGDFCLCRSSVCADHYAVIPPFLWTISNHDP